MASLRNAVKRKTHKERSQPSARKKYGLLEKKSDYKLRARDYRRKKGRLRLLKEKATYRNPDEFYFSMVKKHTLDGIHQDGGCRGSSSVYDSEPLSKGIKKLFRSQDAAYVQTKLNQETRKIEKLNDNLHFLGSSKTNNSRHTIFVEKAEDLDNFSATEYFNTVESLKNRAYNRPSKDKLLNASISHLSNLTYGKAKNYVGDDNAEVTLSRLKRQMKKVKKKRKRAYRELNARIEREEKLQFTVNHLELRKQLNSGGRRRKMKDGNEGNPAVYKWKMERKR